MGDIKPYDWDLEGDFITCGLADEIINKINEKMYTKIEEEYDKSRKPKNG